jgi:hypothetical protein
VKGEQSGRTAAIYHVTSSASAALRHIDDAMQAADRALPSKGVPSEGSLFNALRLVEEAMEAADRALPSGNRAPYKIPAPPRKGEGNETAKERQPTPPTALVEQENARDDTTSEQVRDDKDVSRLKVSALADVCAVTAELLGVDSYFNVNWLDTMTSEAATVSDVEDARKAMMAALNHVIPLRDASDDDAK